MNMSAEIAVIIPVKDGAGTIARALRSALRQSVPPAEVVVVANGTTDSTLEEVALFGPAVRVVTLPEADLSAARRAGVEATTAPLILFLDADDTLHPRALADAAETMRLTGASVVQLRLMQTFRLRGGVTLCRPMPCRYRLDRAIEGALGCVRDFHPGVSAKLFRRDFLTPMPSTGYHGFWGEDRLFSLELYAKRNLEFKIAYSAGARYMYTYGGGSATPSAAEADAAFREVYGLMDSRLDALGLAAYRPLLRANLARLLADRAAASRPSPRRLLRRLIASLLRP